MRISHFETYQQGYSFHRIVASIDIIAQKEIIRVRNIASNAEKLDQVMELAMHVSTNRNRCRYKLNVGLLCENLGCSLGDELDLRL